MTNCWLCHLKSGKTLDFDGKCKCVKSGFDYDFYESSDDDDSILATIPRDSILYCEWIS